jgi:hypothetical protein
MTMSSIRPNRVEVVNEYGKVIKNTLTKLDEQMR